MEIITEFVHLSLPHIGLSLFISGFSLYLLGLFIYRLFLSPIANIPGPKLTAVTDWYETYHDVYKGGKFIFKVEEWHQQYVLVKHYSKLS